jgi:hypothetical protein
MQAFKLVRNVVSTCVALLAIIAPAARATGQTPPSQGAKTVLLVHGAWADGSSWSKVIPLLEAKGLHVVSVQIPLTSFADDVAATQRAIALEDGPVLLLGHNGQQLDRLSNWILNITPRLYSSEPVLHLRIRVQHAAVAQGTNTHTSRSGQESLVIPIRNCVLQKGLLLSSPTQSIISLELNICNTDRTSGGTPCALT